MSDNLKPANFSAARWHQRIRDIGISGNLGSRHLVESVLPWNFGEPMWVRIVVLSALTKTYSIAVPVVVLELSKQQVRNNYLLLKFVAVM